MCVKLPTNQPTNQPTNRPTNQPTNQPNQPEGPKKCGILKNTLQMVERVILKANLRSPEGVHVAISREFWNEPGDSLKGPHQLDGLNRGHSLHVSFPVSLAGRAQPKPTGRPETRGGGRRKPRGGGRPQPPAPGSPTVASRAPPCPSEPSSSARWPLLEFREGGRAGGDSHAT